MSDYPTPIPRLADHPKWKGLPRGPSGPYDGDMERIARLEEDMREVKADLKVVRSDLAELKGKVSMLPGYGGIALIVGLMMAVATLAQRYLPAPPPP